MPNRVPLDNVDHQSLRVALRHALDQDRVNQALVVPTEFEEVQRDFPIFIRKDTEGKFVAVAVLGLDKGENLFLEDDRWTSRYVPAAHRRGPFFLGLRESIDQGESNRELAVHIDLDDPRVGTESGEPLFREHGGNSPYLDHVTQTLHTLHEGLSAAPHMFSLLDELGLIQPIEIEAQLDDGKSYHLPSLFTIAMEQLQALTGPSLEKLHKSGFLAPTIFIRSSLPNLNHLIDLKKRKLALA